ncbi:hypothetical protein [uncultured Duodenibacillus sp.]|uniref:hypothetical protein n=1 Tax=uncultured Duodenibacillus sp. TaxID=1980699 RepID=UPI00258BC10E|nr:hypothetical protein [uncultured Duodenibacillus sp.]
MTITLTLADIKEMISRRYKQLDVWSTQNFYDLQAKEIDELRDLLDKMTKGRELSVRALLVRDQKDAASLPKTASEVEAETERLVRNAQEAACHSIYTLTTELSHLASTHEEGRNIPEDANKAVGILGELIENVKTLYRITAGDSSRQTE